MLDWGSLFKTFVARRTKDLVTKAHNAYQTTCEQGQKDRLKQTVYYKMTSSPYMQHYVDYFNNIVPYVNFYSRKDIILDEPPSNGAMNYFAIENGKVKCIPLTYIEDMRLDGCPNGKITQTTELASANLKSSSYNGVLNVLHIIQQFQAHLNEKLEHITLAHLLPYINYIMEENIHIPLHTFTLSVEYFDDDDETQHITFHQYDRVFRDSAGQY